MSHMVIYRTTDGQPGYHQTEVLDDAVAFVERLRNADGVDEARIFRMEEVEFDFKPYFRVEVGNEALPSRAAAPMASPTLPPPPVAAVAPAPLEERGWMDLPVIDEPAPSMARADRSPMEPRLMALIGELSVRSDLFAKLWGEGEVHSKTTGSKVIDHPELGVLDLEWSTLEVAGAPGQLVVAYQAVEGSASVAVLDAVAARPARRS